MPRDAIRLSTNDLRLLTLADRLWDRAPAAPAAPAALVLRIDTVVQETPTGLDQPTERWDVGTDDVELSLGGVLHARLECARGCLTARVSAALLEREPSRVARLLLETPAAALLARRGYGVVHAGAVVGPGGAVVIRGAPSAGKSTLVAAAHQAGLGVLGDESVLAARHDPDDLLAAVRDVTLLPDATALLGLERAVAPAGPGEGAKDRLDLSASSTPAVRRARRVATVLLGPRAGTRAALERLDAETFLREFERGTIAQESWSGTPPQIATHWSRRGAYRLTGAADLAGAVDLLAELAVRRAAASNA